MLPNSLTTNEIKNGLGNEVEFQRRSQGDNSEVFSAILETPTLTNRLTIKHTESGVGVNRRRRSLVRFDQYIAGQIDTTVNALISAYTVMDLPIGNMSNYSAANNTLAQLMSFLASLGASTAILYDCTGNGAVCLINGTL